ncbi:MAG: response regulator [Deltaproteobacteria bacterium]|nr:response regulator [Deltaproteobacteria bacterium]
MLDDEELLTGFLEEAQEHLASVEPDLLALESSPTDTELINRLFRSVHSIKGGSGFFNLNKMNQLAHAMENLLSKARMAQVIINREHTDALLLGVDRLNLMIGDIVNSSDLDVSKELELLASLGADETAGEVPAEFENSVAAVPVEKTEKNIQPHPDEFIDLKTHISDEDIKKALKKGMNVYAVTMNLNRDIINQDKTPFVFINELEELGWFIDSYLDTGFNENADEGDLRFVFVFGTIMEPDLVVMALSVTPEQVRLYDPNQTVSDQPIPVLPESDVTTVEVSEQPVASLKPAEKVTKESMPAAGSEVASKKNDELKTIKTEESIRVSVGKLNKLVDLAGELVLVRNRLLQTGENEGRNIPGFLGILQSLNMVTSGLQEEILNTRMQPISTVFGKYTRLIRELGSSLKKEIVLITEGNSVELDKTVLEALSDPLTHIIRNTADHGIELPAERKAKGKPVKGTLSLKAFHESGQVIILIEDDGKGIDPEVMAEKALEKGLITQNDLQLFNHQDRINLIFLPGFSTAEAISSVSGRGVGMDVVRSNIEGIGGTVELHSVFGKGTTIKMTLPLTMAIVSCLIVKSCGERFAIPQLNLEELVIVKPDEVAKRIGYVQEQEVLKIRGELLPLISLAQGLGIPVPTENGSRKSGEQQQLPVEMSEEDESVVSINDALRVLVVSAGNNRTGILVDSILGTEEIVVKPMPEYLSGVTVFSGATILGDGAVAMILDSHAFIQGTRLMDLDKNVSSFVSEEEAKSMVEQQSILIFDNGTDEQFAVTIPLIQRVDTISLNQIQYVGDKEYIEYHGQQIRILRLSDYLPIQKPAYDADSFNIIIPKETRIPVAILIHKVLDTQTMKIDLSEGSIHEKGIHGSTLINGKITLLLDLYTILEMGEPDSLHFMRIEKHKLSNAKVLLVEDTPMFMAVIREYLESAELDVTTAINGRLALDIMKSKKFDLILSDIEMPVMDGWELIAAIRNNEKTADLPVIALTSLDDKETIKAGLEAGFNEWMVKLDKHKILASIANHL